MNYINKHILFLDQDMYNAKDSIGVTEENQHNSHPLKGVGFGRIYWKWIFIFIISCFFFLLVYKGGEAGPLSRIWRGPLTFLLPP